MQQSRHDRPVVIRCGDTIAPVAVALVTSTKAPDAIWRSFIVASPFGGLVCDNLFSADGTRLPLTNHDEAIVQASCLLPFDYFSRPVGRYERMAGSVIDVAAALQNWLGRQMDTIAFLASTPTTVKFLLALPEIFRMAFPGEPDNDYLIVNKADCPLNPDIWTKFSQQCEFPSTLNRSETKLLFRRPATKQQPCTAASA